MNENRARQFLYDDKLMQQFRKNGRTCEKIEVYKYLMNLCDRESGTRPDDIERDANGWKIGRCTQCGTTVDDSWTYCPHCGERQIWEE